MTEWRQVPGAEHIEVSSSGEVRHHGRIVNQHGAAYNGLYRGVSVLGVPYAVHRIVATAWHPNPEGLPCVMHLDDNPSNNRPENLRWGTRADNNRDRAEKGRTRNQHMGKTHCKWGHELSDDNLILRVHEGRTWRKCRACKRIQAAKSPASPAIG